MHIIVSLKSHSSDQLETRWRGSYLLWLREKNLNCFQELHIFLVMGTLFLFQCGWEFTTILVPGWTSLVQLVSMCQIYSIHFIVYSRQILSGECGNVPLLLFTVERNVSVCVFMFSLPVCIT